LSYSTSLTSSYCTHYLADTLSGMLRLLRHPIFLKQLWHSHKSFSIKSCKSAYLLVVNASICYLDAGFPRSTRRHQHNDTEHAPGRQGSQGGHEGEFSNHLIPYPLYPHCGSIRWLLPPTSLSVPKTSLTCMVIKFSN